MIGVSGDEVDAYVASIAEETGEAREVIAYSEKVTVKARYAGCYVDGDVVDCFGVVRQPLEPRAVLLFYSSANYRVPTPSKRSRTGQSSQVYPGLFLRQVPDKPGTFGLYGYV